MRWTKPFYGVTHLEVPRSSGYQFTVEDHGQFALSLIFPIENHPWLNCKEAMHADAETAKGYAETQAVALTGCSLAVTPRGRQS